MLHVVVPARAGSTRLPNKMLQRIGGRTVIEHSIHRVREATRGLDLILATDSHEIAERVGEHPGSVDSIAITSLDCRSGTDRCAEVADLRHWPDDDIVVNVQADMPFIDPEHLRNFIAAAAIGGPWHVMTAICDHHVVEVLPHNRFRRTSLCAHVGLYAYKREALRRFAALGTSPGEERERLEQLRAAENGFIFAYHMVPEMPPEVNTPEDLAALQRIATWPI